MELGYVGPDHAEPGALPPVAVLGAHDETLYLRFDVALPPGSKVVEAYVVLRRPATALDDPDAVTLHAASIVGPWSGREISWRHQHRLFDANFPATTVTGHEGSLVRVDVAGLVDRWAYQPSGSHGIAIVGESKAGRGMTIALLEQAEPNATLDTRPFLELYVLRD